MSSILADIYERYRIVHGCIAYCIGMNHRFDDDDKGRWITTEDGNRVHLNEEGKPDKGNPYVIAAMTKPEKKPESDKAGQKMSGGSKPHAADAYEFETAPAGTKLTYEDSSGQKVTWTKLSDVANGYVNDKTGEKTTAVGVYLQCRDSDVSLYSPDEAENSSGSTALPYASERLQNAVNPQTPQEADELYRRKSGEVWQSLSYKTRNALVDFTGDGFVKINSALRYGNEDDDVSDEIDSMTSAIAKSKLDQDAWFRRGVDLNAVKNMFGVNDEISPDSISRLVGKTGQDKGFMSCGSTFDTGIDTDVSLRIFAPAGTQALYAEPFSLNGWGEKQFWDGKSKQNLFSDEMETMLQRGSWFQCIGARHKEDGTYELDLAITNQTPD